MRATSVVIVSLACFLAVVSALPAKPNEEVEIVPLEEQFGRYPGVVDTGIVGGPFNSPFDGLFDSLAGVMSRMRAQMDYLLNRLPSLGNSSYSDNGPFFGFPDIDLSKGNTTSVTKVIDGHKVVINETEYKQGGDSSGTYFKVRIIDVKPDSSELTTEKNAEEITPESNKDIESSENSFENEIPKNRESEDFSKIETFDEVDNNRVSDRIKKWDRIEPLESFEDNSVEYEPKPVDLSHDIDVNRIMADAGAPVNPDAEVFSSVESYHPRQFEKYMNPR